MSPITPTVGRIVLYTPAYEDDVPAPEAPAIVVAIGKEPDTVNLRVFLDGPDTIWLTNVIYNEAGAPGTWRWMPYQVQKAGA